MPAFFRLGSGFLNIFRSEDPPEKSAKGQSESFEYPTSSQIELSSPGLNIPYGSGQLVDHHGSGQKQYLPTPPPTNQKKLPSLSQLNLYVQQEKLKRAQELYAQKQQHQQQLQNEEEEENEWRETMLELLTRTAEERDWATRMQQEDDGFRDRLMRNSTLPEHNYYHHKPPPHTPTPLRNWTGRPSATFLQLHSSPYNENNNNNGEGSDSNDNGGADDVNANSGKHIAEIERLNPDKGLKCDYIEELRASQREMIALQRQGWPTEATYLFHKISMRGYEPLMPSNWSVDFETMPLTLFVEQDRERAAFIKAEGGSDFRAIHALRSLTTLGSRARNAVRANRSPEKVLRRGIAEYVQWSHRDILLHHRTTIPNLILDVNSAKCPASTVESRMLRKMDELAARWKANLSVIESVETDYDTDPDDRSRGGASKGKGQRSNSSLNTGGYGMHYGFPEETNNTHFNPKASTSQRRPSTIRCYHSPYTSATSTSSATPSNKPSSTPRSSNQHHQHPSTPSSQPTEIYLRPLPILYGAIISHTVVGIVAFDPIAATAHPCLRTISFFDFGDPAYDVWNALGLAIVAVHCRNALRDLVVFEEVEVEDRFSVEGDRLREERERYWDGVRAEWGSGRRIRGGWWRRREVGEEEEEEMWGGDGS